VEPDQNTNYKVTEKLCFTCEVTHSGGSISSGSPMASTSLHHIKITRSYE